MAAIAYPMGGGGRPRRAGAPATRRSRDELPHLRLVGSDETVAARVPVQPERRVGVGRAPSRVAGPRLLTRWLPGVATVAALVGLWAGAGALSAARPHTLQSLPGARRVASGYVYVVRPGDTLWAIATRIDPNGDPRPVVAALTAELHGGALQPGEQLRLP